MNSKLLPASVKMIVTFEFGEKRLVVFCERHKGLFGFLYLFEDAVLRQVEKDFLLREVSRSELVMDEYCLERRMAGVFGVLSGLDAEAREVYGSLRVGRRLSRRLIL